MKLTVTSIHLSDLPFEEVYKISKILSKYNSFVGKLEVSELRQAHFSVQFELPIKNLPTRVPLTEKIKEHIE